MHVIDLSTLESGRSWTCSFTYIHHADGRRLATARCTHVWFRTDGGREFDRLGICGVRLLAHRSRRRLLGTEQGYSDLCALLPVGWAGLRRSVSRADEKVTFVQMRPTMDDIFPFCSSVGLLGMLQEGAPGRSPDPRTLSKGSNKGGLEYAEEGHLSVHHIIQPCGLVSWPWNMFENILCGSPEQSKNILLLFIHLG